MIDDIKRKFIGLTQLIADFSIIIGHPINLETFIFNRVKRNFYLNNFNLNLGKLFNVIVY